ncbi:MAG: response regulator [Candidatus Delongbacteria bacterium]|nr:response regulator [Candidatus Delongbacteria bacterium]MBN2836716.1 response regulator [Candidatus Delongbacteria bacterium]
MKMKHRILIVDDDVVNLKILERLLKDFEIISISEPLKFYDLAKEIRPDLFLLDVEMPVLSGLTICKILKNDPELKETPVIFLTSRDDIHDIFLGFNVGASDYITKPYQMHELMQRLSSQLSLVEIIKHKGEDKADKIIEFVMSRYKEISDLVTHSLNVFDTDPELLDRLKSLTDDIRNIVIMFENESGSRV